MFNILVLKEERVNEEQIESAIDFWGNSFGLLDSCDTDSKRKNTATALEFLSKNVIGEELFRENINLLIPITVRVIREVDYKLSSDEIINYINKIISDFLLVNVEAFFVSHFCLGFKLPINSSCVTVMSSW